jgi:hypothetical protein
LIRGIVALRSAGQRLGNLQLGLVERDREPPDAVRIGRNAVCLRYALSVREIGSAWAYRIAGRFVPYGPDR